MARRFTKYPSNYVKASSTPKSSLSNGEYISLRKQILQNIPITESDFEQLVLLRDDYNSALRAEMRKPAQKCDLGYAQFMRDNAQEVNELIEKAIVE